MADRYRRFTVSDRLEHVVQLTAFTVLAVTGLTQRYSEAWLSQRLIEVLGGIETVRIIHRIFATILMIGVVYHIGAIGYRKFVQRRPKEMLPTRADIAAAAHSMRYLAGRESAPPLQGRFTWEEKVEYFALVWGTFVMIVSGFLLWNPVATSRLLPGQFIPAAKVFHSGEALLAVLAVIVWHMFHVHIRRFNTSMFTGYMSRRDMAHEHGLELEAIENGTAFTPPRDEASRRRARIYLPAFTGVAAILLAGIFLFVTFENTAIATITPPEQVAIYAPVETSGTTTATTGPGTSTSTTTTVPAPVGAWEDTIQAIFRTQRCTNCHGNAMALGGVNLATYDGALAAVIPGDPDRSPLIVLQEARAHPTLLDEGQLAQVRAWIAAGALEALGGTPPTEGPAGAPSWDDPISGMLAGCTGCHGGANPAAGLDLSSYETALARLVPGDADASPLYSLQAAGGHPGQLSEADLAVLREWILAGAPQTAAQAPETSTTTTAVPPQAGPTWDDPISGMLAGCAGCHGGANPTAGLDLTSQEGVLAGLVPGDPESSRLYLVQAGGGHPVQLSDTDLAVLREWILNGAP